MLTRKCSWKIRLVVKDICVPYYSHLQTQYWNWDGYCWHNFHGSFPEFPLLSHWADFFHDSLNIHLKRQNIEEIVNMKHQLLIPTCKLQHKHLINLRTCCYHRHISAILSEQIRRLNRSSRDPPIPHSCIPQDYHFHRLSWPFHQLSKAEVDTPFDMWPWITHLFSTVHLADERFVVGSEFGNTFPAISVLYGGKLHGVVDQDWNNVEYKVFLVGELVRWYRCAPVDCETDVGVASTDGLDLLHETILTLRWEHHVFATPRPRPGCGPGFWPGSGKILGIIIIFIPNRIGLSSDTQNG